MEYDKDIEEQTGIFVFKNAFTKELCEKTIKLFKESDKTHKGRLAGGYKPTVKTSTDWHIDDAELQGFYNKILIIALTQITRKYQHLRKMNLVFQGLQFQESKVGVGKFTPHIDANLGDPTAPRVLAPIFYLNDVEEGGETKFKYQKNRY